MRRRQEKGGRREQRKKLPQSSDLLPEYHGASPEPSQHLRWTRTSQNQNPTDGEMEEIRLGRVSVCVIVPVVGAHSKVVLFNGL